MKLVELLLILQVALALKLILPAQKQLHTEQRCIREFVPKDTLVAIRGRTSGMPNDGQRMVMSVKDNKGNKYWYKDNVLQTFSAVFTPSADATVDICMGNTLQNGGSADLEREVDIDIEVGAAARDWDNIQASEKLKPAEVELRRADEITEEITRELEYLRLREERLRNTNESTNSRVRTFFFFTVLAFIGFGAWQIIYLRAYFRSKHII